ncbi:MAG: hypothetical protein QN122_12040 [Armatimonadota bacterium]|nr:hypothetical protein [Armatimonadota bacterium]
MVEDATGHMGAVVVLPEELASRQAAARDLDRYLDSLADGQAKVVLVDEQRGPLAVVVGWQRYRRLLALARLGQAARQA